MKSQGEAGEEPQRTDSPAQQTGAETQEEAFDEPDDELEEFDEIGEFYDHTACPDGCGRKENGLQSQSFFAEMLLLGGGGFQE